MFPFELEKEDRRWALLFVAIAVAEVVVLFVMGWKLADGHFMFPLDDAYIHLQYAAQMLRDGPLIYTPGMSPSGGMTSPLYVLLLVPLHAVGLHGAKAAFASFLFGAVLWALLPIWVYQLAKRLTTSRCAPFAAGLVLANGHLLWTFLSGMETGLFTILVVGAVLSAAVWWQSERVYARYVFLACLGMLPLVRPEGAAVTIVALGVVLLRRGQEPRLSAVSILVSLLPFVVWLGVLELATGDWRPAGLTVKGLSAYPYMGLAERIAFAGDTLAHIATRFYFNTIPDPVYAAFKGTDTMPYVPAGLILLTAFGAGWIVVTEWRTGRAEASMFLALVWVVGLCSLCASRLPFVHHQRYLAPWTVPAILLGIVAVHRLAQLFQQHEERAAQAVAGALIVLSLPSLGFWIPEYGRNSRDIYHLLRVASFSMPQGEAPVAITDAGVLAYYNNRPMVDLVGLTTPQFAEPVNHGEGAVLEAMASLPQRQRPISLLSYAGWWSDAFPLEEPDWALTIPRTTITSGTTLFHWPIDWNQIELGDRPPVEPGRPVLFSLDIADLADEERAGYTFVFGTYDDNPNAWPKPNSPVTRFEIPPVLATDAPTTEPLILAPAGTAADGGRVVRGETFLLRPVRFPKRAAVLHTRLALPPAWDAFFPHARRLHFTLASTATGYPIRRTLDLDMKPGDAQTLALDLEDAFDEAGGESWLITVRPEPEGASWISHHYWITANVPEDEP